VIAFLRGRVLRRTEDRVVLEAGGVGYEVHLPAVVARGLQVGEGEEVALFISYHVTPNQPRPLLVGFRREVEQEFFERFITVDGVGPARAVRAITHPVAAIAEAIERKDVAFLRRLPGIGQRTAEKIVAALHGKMGKYALLQEAAPAGAAPPAEDFRAEVVEVLTRQLGHRPAEARRMVEEALRRNPAIADAEALFQEVYRVRQTAEAPA